MKKAKVVATPDAVDTALLQAAKENAKLRQQLLEQKGLLGESLRQLHEVEARSDYLDVLMREPIPYTEIKPKRITGESSAILALSDWHWEENVDPATVNGKNEYNPRIAAKRARGMFQKAAGLIDFCRGFSAINEIIVAVLGDLINGYIHEEMVEDNFLSPTEALLEVQESLVEGIEFLRKELKPKRMLIPTAVGNHGRTTQRKRIATSATNSFEWLLYKQLAWYYRNDPIVQWRVGRGYHNWLEVQGHKVRMHHGDAIRYQGGIGGISIPVNKAIAAWNKTETAVLDIFGHYHQSKTDRCWTSNGSLVGYNAFAVEIKADYEEPSQTLTLMSRSRGKIMDLRVFCE